jgi:hypothetical protein
MKKDVLSTEKVNIFFDESGNNNIKYRPTLMAGLLIPDPIYNNEDYVKMNEKLIQNSYLPLHWTEYSGYKPLRNDILEVITVFTRFSKLCKMNVINYDESSLNERKKFYSDKSLSKIMIYTKLPERILYGLLRKYGKDVHVNADLFVENSSTYSALDLSNRIVEQLNTQSMYRAEQYSVLGCRLTPKKQQIGVEITDLLMGIVRTIIQNNNDVNTLSKGQRMRNELVVELLRIDAFYQFMINIKYYEWQSTRELSEVNFKEYVDLFLSSNNEQYFKIEKHEENLLPTVTLRNNYKRVTRSVRKAKVRKRGIHF